MSTATRREDTEHPGWVVAYHDGTFYSSVLNPVVFASRAAAERAAHLGWEQQGLRLTLRQLYYQLVECAWSEERWSGVDAKGQPTALLCDECMDKDARRCVHRGAHLCPECGEVRPVSFFTIAPDAVDVRWGRRIELYRGLVTGEEVPGVCDACARDRANEVVEALLDRVTG